MQHVPMFCDVRGCEDEATHWIEQEGGKVSGTFYLCQDHKEMIQDDNEEYVHITPNGEVEGLEIALYACSEECTVCE